MYVVENSDLDDPISVLFFITDLDRSLTVERDELEYIFSQLNIQCDKSANLILKLGSGEKLSYQMFYVLMLDITQP